MKLYYLPGACSLAPHIVLEELGLTYDIDRVNPKTKQTQNGGDYLAINAKGYVPALELDNVHVITEGMIISQYLADQNPQAGLLPVSGEARYNMLSMMAYIATELHKGMGALFNPHLSEEMRAKATALLTKRVNWAVEQMGQQPYLCGEQFSIADAYLFTVLGWAGKVGFDLSHWPALSDYQQRIAARPAVQKAMKAEGLI